MLKKTIFAISLFLVIFLLALGGTSTWTAAAQTGDAIPSDFWNDTTENFRSIIEAGFAITSGAEIRIKAYAHSANLSYIDGTSIGIRAGGTEDFSSTPTRITWDNGNNTTSLAAGTTKWSDWVAFNFDESVDHLVNYFVTDAHDLNAQLWSDTNPNTYRTADGVDYTMTVDWTADGTWNNMYLIGDIEVRNITVFCGVNFDEENDN